MLLVKHLATVYGKRETKLCIIYRYCWPNTHDCLRQKIVLHAYALVNSVMYHMSRLLIHAIAAGCSYLYALRGYVTCDCTVAIAPRTVKTITKTLDTTRL